VPAGGGEITIFYPRGTSSVPTRLIVTNAGNGVVDFSQMKFSVAVSNSVVLG
jgi:hypothetical protein